MYGRVDRGGSREGKKSLRKNKIAIVEQKKILTQTPKLDLKDLASLPPPALRKEDGDKLGLIDAGANLVTRRFESDQSRVIQRALDSGIDAVIVLTNDFDKQADIISLMKEHSGAIYGCVGIHPDNVKRTNDKLYAQRVDQLKEWARLPETVAVTCGLDFTREFATHYSQEKLMFGHVDLAVEVKLPLVIVDLSATEKIVEKLKEVGESLVGAAVYNFMGSEAEIDSYMSVESTAVYFIITGAICCDNDSELFEGFIPVLNKIPLDRLILATDSPKYTPQNIEDPYIKQQKNEPSNLPYVLKSISQLLNKTEQDLSKIVKENTMRFFKLRFPQDEDDEEENDSEEEEEEESIAEEEEDEEEVDEEKSEEKESEESEEDSKEEEETPKKKKGGRRRNKNKKKNQQQPPPLPVVEPPKKQQQKQQPKQQQQQQQQQQKQQQSQQHKKQPEQASEKKAKTSNNHKTKPIKIVEAIDIPSSDEEDEKEVLSKNIEKLRIEKEEAEVETEVLAHEQGLEQLRDISKKSKNDVEYDSANVMFVKEVPWMKERRESDYEEMPSTEGKLDCPKCSSKHIGKWILPRGSSTPVYLLKKKRVEAIIQGKNAKLVARIQEDELVDENEEADTKQNKTKRARRKKQQKATNKSYGVKTPVGGKKKGKTTNQNDDDEE